MRQSQDRRNAKRQRIVAEEEKRQAEARKRAEEARVEAYAAREKQKVLRKKARLDKMDARVEEKERRLATATRERKLKEARVKEQAERRRARDDRRREKSAWRNEHPRFYNPNLRLHTVLAVLLTLVAVYIGLGFLLRDMAGVAGSSMAAALLGCFSAVAWLIPAFMLIHALLWRRDVADRMLWQKALAFLPFLALSAALYAACAPGYQPAAFSASTAYTDGQTYAGGGAVGGFLASFLVGSIGMLGLVLLFVVSLLLLAYLYFRNPLHAFAVRLRTAMQEKRVMRAHGRMEKKAGRAAGGAQEGRSLPRANAPRLTAAQSPATPAEGQKRGATDAPAGRTDTPTATRGTEPAGEQAEAVADRRRTAEQRRRMLFRDLEESTLAIERQGIPSGNRGARIFDFEDEANTPAEDGDDIFAPTATASPAAPFARRLPDLMTWDEDGDDFDDRNLTVTHERLRPIQTQPAAPAGGAREASPARPAAPARREPAASVASEETGLDYFRSITVAAEVPQEKAPARVATDYRAAETSRTPTYPAEDAAPTEEPATATDMFADALGSDGLNESADTFFDGDDGDGGDEEELAPFVAPTRPSPTPTPAPAPASAPTATAGYGSVSSYNPAPAFTPVSSAPLRPQSAAPAAKPAAPKPKRPYQFPPVSLLALPEVVDEGNIAAEVQSNAEKLVETLDNFKVRTRVSGYSRGPRITRYEVVPEAGVRVRAISSLVEDISMSLATSGIRIEAPIPGKSAVGVEVPNATPTVVGLRRLLDSEKFRNFPDKTMVCLGEDVGGQPVYADLAKMPHMLVAGATGMGKSVCINSIVVSLLYKASPDDVKLIMIDPKKVEFGIYSGIPHLLVPVVTDPKKAAGALSWAVNEMERRFDLIERAGVRDIKGYNRTVTEGGEGETLPKIIIIIDELHDLMMSAADAVETSIARIAAKARAAGIHLLIGTQRPSVDVITGTIKANIPSRVAFHVSSQVDSRTILDFAGAEKLLARGDMLFAPVGMSKPLRVQGAFVDDKEVDRVVEFLKQNNEVDEELGDRIMADIEREAEKCTPQKKADREEGFGGGGTNIPTDDDDHHLQWAALEVGFEFGRMSTSLLQRKLSIGYGKAAKILDALESEGYISAQEGAKPREIKITREEFKEMMARGVAEATGGNFGQ